MNHRFASIGPLYAPRTAALAALAAVVSILGAAPASADGADATPRRSDVTGAAPTPATHDWEISVAPYVWGISMKGEASVGDLTFDVDMPFSEVVDKLNGAFFGKVEVRRDRFLVMLDGFGARLESEASAGPVTLGFGPATLQQSAAVGPRGRGRATATVQIPRVETQVGPAELEIDFKMAMVNLLAGYRVLSRPLAGDADPRRLVVDLLAGGRYWYAKAEASLFVSPTTVPGFPVNPSLTLSGPRGRSRRYDLGGIEIPGITTAGIDESREESNWWIDPVVGLRVHADLWESVGFNVGGDVGGFGIGSASDLTWQALGLASWRFAESWTLEAGYRAIGVDHNAGQLDLDIVIHGPVMGFVWRFGR